MQNLIEVAQDVQNFCSTNHWKFCFIGGLAVQHWGESRLTRDVDLTLLTGFGHEEPFIEKLLEKYSPRIPDAREFALSNRVVLLKTSNNIGIDISLGGLPFEEQVVERSINVEMLKGYSLKLCSPEDLIVLKAFASREIDWHDIKGVVIRQTSKALNWSYIDAQIGMLAEAKEDPSILEKLEKIKNNS